VSITPWLVFSQGKSPWYSLDRRMWLSHCLLSSLCLVFVSVSSCADLPRLYDTLVQLLFNSRWDGNAL
jgi:hypothetical protein